MDVFCRRCQHWEQRAQTPRRGEPCPSCGAVLAPRRRPSPSPATHLRALVTSLRSTPGILFLVLYALSLGVTSALGRPYLAALLLYAGAVRLAWRAMNMRGDEIEFPQLGADELFNRGVLKSVGLFSILFVLLPVVLIQLAVDGRLLSLPAAIALAVLLFAYAPMALLLFLRSNTALGMFQLPTAVGLVASDPRGYLFLAGLVLVALGLRVGLGAATGALGMAGALALGFVLAPLEAALVLIAFGLCGLYVRSKARQLRVPCDDDDWEPGSILGDDAAAAPPPPAVAPPLAPVVLPPVRGADGQDLLLDDIPAVTGQLLGNPAQPPIAPAVLAAPAPLQVAPPLSAGTPGQGPMPPTVSSIPQPAAAPGAPAWPWDEPARPPAVVVGQVLAAPPVAPGAASTAAARPAATQIMGSIQVPMAPLAAPSPRPAVPAPVSGVQAVPPVRPVAAVGAVGSEPRGAPRPAPEPAPPLPDPDLPSRGR